MTPEAATTVPDAPRILLFGHPRSGKSSLLGALLRAGETQGGVLGYEVIDPTGRLNLIRDHVYGGAPFENTGTELVTYAVRLRPLQNEAQPAGEPQTVVLMDCDGGAANALLKHPDPLIERGVKGTIATAVVKSDLIALVVNVGAGDAELDTAFDEFLMFLERVHGRKAFEREVGGFPIFLVLTQADTLAEKGDTRAEWEGRLRGNLRYALRRFAEFLEDQEPVGDTGSPFLPFGSVELEGYTVAVRRPPLADDPHPPDEPFGVAEMFRDAFAAAKAHFDRARRSQRRLRVTAWSVVLTVAAMLVGAVGLSVFQPTQSDPGLAERVRGFELSEPPAAVRLAEKNIARTKRTLTAFEADPGFFALPDDLREFVTGRLKEIEDYQAYRAKLSEAPAPAEARTLEELAHTEAVLTTDLALPPQYTWGETEAARLRDKWLADIPLIRAAEAAWQEWYRGLVNQALALSLTRSFDGDWRDRVAALIASSERPPFNPADPIAGSESVPQPRGEPVTYRIPAEFDRVYQARRDWEYDRNRLLHLRDLADALGLTPDPGSPGRRALDIPAPGQGVDPNTLPGERLAELRRYFPRPSNLYPARETSENGLSYPEWELSNFPQPGRGVLAARLRESYWNGVRQVRGLILQRLGNPPAANDNPAGWQRVADGLGDPVFRDWGRLLHLLARLENPQAADPVVELAAFLGPRVETRTFPIDLKGVELTIPLALRVPAVVPTGPVTLTVSPRAALTPITRVFPQSEKGGESQGLATTYRLRPDPAGPLTYHPGDGLKIEVPVRSGDQRFTLVWDEGGTRTFQFDRLGREPKLVPATGAAEPATGVTLAPGPGSTVPRVPALLPEVRR